MKKTIILFGAFLLLSINSFAQPQPPDSLWSRTFGGNDFDRCFSAQQTSDGGYIFVGETNSFGTGDYDFWMVKTDGAGDSLWSKTYGGNEDDECYSIQQTSDGGYILAGFTKSFGGRDPDFWLVKTDENGDSLWSRTFGGDYSDLCWSIQQTTDGGYILAGYTQSLGAGLFDFWLVKTDEIGDSLWSRTFGGDGFEECHSVQQTEDGGYVLAGYTSSYGSGAYDFWLVKTDEIGDSLWSQTFGGSEDDLCNSIRQTSDEGYILAGYTKSFGAGEYDFWIIKTDENGDSLWSRTFGGLLYEKCFSVQQTTEGGYILAGYIQPYGVYISDFWLVKTDEDGDSLWSITFGGDDLEECYSVQQTSDGGYILAGYTHSFGACRDDFWIIKVGADVGVEDFSSFSLPNAFSFLPAHPNPFNPVTQITFSLPMGADVSLVVYDINGREVSMIANGWCQAGIHQAIFDGSELASGMYFAKFTAGDFNQTRKLVLVK